MKSHELANALLGLPDRETLIVLPAGGEYVSELTIVAGPWMDLMNQIRVQVTDHAANEKRAAESKEESNK